MFTAVERLSSSIEKAKKHMSTFEGYKEVMEAIKELNSCGIDYNDMLKITVGIEDNAMLFYFLSLYENLYRFVSE